MVCPKSSDSGRSAMAPLVPSAVTETCTRSSRALGSPRPAPDAPRAEEAPSVDAPSFSLFSYELGTRRLSATLNPSRLIFRGQNVQCDCTVSPPRIIPPAGLTLSTSASVSGMLHSYSTLMRLTLVTSTSLAATAPTQVGLNTNASFSPTRSLGKNPRARASSASACSVDPLSAHTNGSRRGVSSFASNRNVTSANDRGLTTPFVG
mmetsp:Transcript_3189/g.12823  ORF Transcript_3189/g.12823 Transcript_3189/m.12823 type:complete len:206 (+) Transcript_3189:652-1269(+)